MAHEDAVRVLDGYLDRTNCVDDIRAEVDEIVSEVREAFGDPIKVQRPTVSPNAMQRAEQNVKDLKDSFDRAVVANVNLTPYKTALNVLEAKAREERLRYHIALAAQENGTEYVSNLIVTLGMYCAPLYDAAAGPGETWVTAQINPGTDLASIITYCETWSIPVEVKSSGDCEGTLRVSI